MYTHIHHIHIHVQWHGRRDHESGRRLWEGWRDVDAAHMHEGLKNNNKNEHLSKRDLRGKAIPLKRPLKAQYLDITVKVLREKSKMPLWQNKPTHNLKKKGFNHLFHWLFQDIYFAILFLLQLKHFLWYLELKPRSWILAVQYPILFLVFFMLKHHYAQGDTRIPVTIFFLPWRKWDPLSSFSIYRHNRHYH